MRHHGRLGRAARSSLPIIPGSWVPPLGWHGDSFRLDKVEPVTRARSNIILKPLSGGLWCCPLQSSPFVPGAVWTQWALSQDDLTTQLQLIRARRCARVLVIDSARHLNAALRRWPEQPTNSHVPEPMQFRQLDWPALAQTVDAVWVTRRGHQNLRFTHSEKGLRASLYGWDFETVFFLNRAFTIGRLRTVPVRTIRETKTRLQKNFEKLIMQMIEEHRAGALDPATVHLARVALRQISA